VRTLYEYGSMWVRIPPSKQIVLETAKTFGDKNFAIK